MRTLTELEVYTAIEEGQTNITTDLFDLRPWGYKKHGRNSYHIKQWVLSSATKRCEQLYRATRNDRARHCPKGTLRGDRCLVRSKHRHKYAQFKKILDPEGLTCLHHNWIPGTSAYTGYAIVEKAIHERYHEFVQPLELKDGKIIVHGLNGEEEP